MDINFEDNSWIKKTQVFVPYEEFLSSMDLDLHDRFQRDIFFPHIFWGLRRLALISDFSYLNVSTINKRYPEANGPGFIILPSIFGIELYLWANGHPDVPTFHFLNEDIQFVSVDLLEMPHRAIAFGCNESDELLYVLK